MRLLSTFFPRHPRPRTVVHAGSLLIRRPDGVRALRRYLRIPRPREVFLLHQGQEPLRHAAKDAGVSDIALETSAKQEANAATEMALALGARRLDFTIDEPGVVRPDGDLMPEISVNEAEQLARDPEVRPKIRAKLSAGCEALRQGVSRVRIGDPAALTKGRATTLVPDPSMPLEAREDPPGLGACNEVAASDSGYRHPFVFAHSEHPRLPGSQPRSNTSGDAPPRRGEIGVPITDPEPEPEPALSDPWWRLRGRATRRARTPAHA